MTMDTSKPVEKDGDETEVDISCGIWKLRTNKFGKKFSNLYVFTILMGFSAMFSNMVDEVIRVQLISMEKQFNIGNSSGGLLLTAKMIGSLCTVFWAGHFCKDFHIPVIVGISGVIQGLLLTIPSFLQFANPYQLEVVEASTRNLSSNSLLCTADATGTMSNQTNHSSQTSNIEKEQDMTAYYVVLMVSLLTGMTNTFHAGFLPNVYLDDNIQDKSKMALFFGIRTVLLIFSSPLGRVISGVLSEIPVDLKETKMSANDPRFISAWWLAYLVFGIGVILTSLPVMLLPRRLLSRKQQLEALHKAAITFDGGHIKEGGEDGAESDQRSDIAAKIPKISLTERNGEEQDTKTASNTHSNHRKERRRSSLNPALNGPTQRRVSLNGSMIRPNLAFAQPAEEDQNASSNLQTFWMLVKDFPKAIMRLLHKPTYTLILFDIVFVSIPFFGLAPFKQIYMSYEFGVSLKDTADYSAISSIVSGLVGVVISSYVTSKVTTKSGYVRIICGTYVLATAISPLYVILGCDADNVYGFNNTDYGLPVNTSLAGCTCPPEVQLLSCGDDGNTYMSPCHAGCNGTDGKIYTDCSLLQGNASTQSVTPGLCPTESKCHTNFLVYVALHGLQAMIEGMSTIPRSLYVLRLVDPKDRAIAVSMFNVLFMMVALPAPNIFGGILDSMCLVTRGQVCVMYNRDHIRYLVGGVDVGIHVIMQTFSIIIVVLDLVETRAHKRKKQQKLEKERNEHTTQDESSAGNKF